MVTESNCMLKCLLKIKIKIIQKLKIYFSFYKNCLLKRFEIFDRKIIARFKTEIKGLGKQGSNG